jgi:hypothetical protein
LIQQQQTKRMTPRLSDVSYHEYFLLPIARSAPKIENYDSQLLICWLHVIVVFQELNSVA